MSKHEPVLLDGVIKHFSWTEADLRVADLTVGLGGHLHALLSSCPPPSYILALDQDQQALTLARERLREWPQIQFEHQNFEWMTNWAGEAFDRIFVDLGVSSLQLDEAARGFSFRQEGPLDMRMDPSRGLSAREWLMSCTEKELCDVLRYYGEERRAPVYARRWVSARKTRSVESTKDFVEAMGYSLESKTPQARHPLTRVFQGIRIFINREFEVLENLIEQLPRLLKKNGRLGIISFHSLEDRRVKWGLRGRLDPINKKVIQADKEERKQNPRSRSAKLRVYRPLSL